MTKKELERKLKSENIRPDMYCLDGGLPNESYCLNKHEDSWEVYYSERGYKAGLKQFTTEDEACEYLYSKIKLDGINF